MKVLINWWFALPTVSSSSPHHPLKLNNRCVLLFDKREGKQTLRSVETASSLTARVNFAVSIISNASSKLNGGKATRSCEERWKHFPCFSCFDLEWFVDVRTVWVGKFIVLSKVSLIFCFFYRNLQAFRPRNAAAYGGKWKSEWKVSFIADKRHKEKWGMKEKKKSHWLLNGWKSVFLINLGRFSDVFLKTNVNNSIFPQPIFCFPKNQLFSARLFYFIKKLKMFLLQADAVNTR